MLYATWPKLNVVGVSGVLANWATDFAIVTGPSRRKMEKMSDWVLYEVPYACGRA